MQLLMTARGKSALAALACAALGLWLMAGGAALAQDKSGSPRSQAPGRSAPGAQAGEAADEYAFELQYINGKDKLTFQDLKESGLPFAIFFWRTDCPLCHMQMPYVQQLQRLIEEGKTELRLVSVCLDDTPRDALPFIEEKALTFEVLFDGHGRRTDANYHAKELGLPLTYAFKKDGKYVDYLTGFRSGYAKSVLQLLDLPLPAELKK